MRGIPLNQPSSEQFWGILPHVHVPLSNRSDLGACGPWLRLASLAFAVYPDMWFRLHVNLALGQRHTPSLDVGYLGSCCTLLYITPPDWDRAPGYKLLI